MPGLVTYVGEKLGWRVRPNNVIVEGLTDVSLLRLAAKLYLNRYNVRILGRELGILHAGLGNDGGVDGLNRRLTTMRQIADIDVAADGRSQYRFIGLYDNDHAGRLGVENACNIDRRLQRCRDLFLLYPIMPLASGANHRALETRFVNHNAIFKGLDWEIEDLLSNKLISAFDKACPGTIQAVHTVGGRKHREYSRAGKIQLHKFANHSARLDDVIEVVRLIRALRDYHGLSSDHIIC